MNSILKPLVEKLVSSVGNKRKLLVDYWLKKSLKLFGRVGFDHVVSMLREDPKCDLSLSLICLETAKNVGILQKHNSGEWRKVLRPEALKSALVNPDDELRHKAFAILCGSSRPSDPIEQLDLYLIRFALPYNLTSLNPAFRQEFLNALKKLLRRLCLLQAKLRKGLKENYNPDAKLFEDFVDWMAGFFFSQLFPGACFARRQISLNLLRFVFEDEPIKVFFPTPAKILNRERADVIMTSLRDTYEENRACSLWILSNTNTKETTKRLLGDARVSEIKRNALQLCRRSCRPEEVKDSAYDLRLVINLSDDPHSQSISICQAILADLDIDVKAAESNLLRSVSVYPMYGGLHCIHDILASVKFGCPVVNRQWRKLITDCVGLCCSVFDAVLPVVGSVSPEGNLPENGAELDGKSAWDDLPAPLRPLVDAGSGDLEQRLVAQRVLVACWRSAKESSLLLQRIASLCPRDSTEDSTDGVFSKNQFLEIGFQLKRQLTEARHRGAFEVAYSAFKSYCHLLRSDDDPELRDYLKQWVTDLVKDITDPARRKDLCSTRRSAGLPFLAQALLGSESGRRSQALLQFTLTSLLELAEDESGERHDGKVHALNVLRGLVRDARLADDVIPYLERCVIAAIKGFACRQWSVRNSSTLLFSALVTRIFGVNREKDQEASEKNRMSSYEFMTRFSRLNEFLCEQLETLTVDVSGQPIERHARLQPSLLILSRVFPSHGTSHSARFKPFLLSCLGSPILKIRDIAARVLVSTTPCEERHPLVESLLSTLGAVTSHNQAHGLMVALQRVRGSADQKSPPKQGIPLCGMLVAGLLRGLCAYGAGANPCSLTRASYIKLFVQTLDDCAGQNGAIGFEYLQGDSLSTVERLLADAAAHLRSDDVSRARCPGQSQLDASIGELLVTACFWHGAGVGSGIHHVERASQAIGCSLRDVRFAALVSLDRNTFSLKRKLPDELAETLLNVARIESDDRALTLIFRILSRVACNKLVSEISALCSHQAAHLPRNAVHLESLMACWARCASHCSFSETTGFVSTPSAASQWLSCARKLCDSGSGSNTVELRQAVAGSLNGFSELCIEDPPNPDLWGLAFLLLVDDDETVRLEACRFVHSVAHRCEHECSFICLDSLALEVAMDCLAKLHGRTQPERCRLIVDDVMATVRLNLEGSTPDGATNNRVFLRGETHFYAELHILERRAERFRVLLSRA